MNGLYFFFLFQGKEMKRWTPWIQVLILMPQGILYIHIYIMKQEKSEKFCVPLP